MITIAEVIGGMMAVIGIVTAGSPFALAGACVGAAVWLIRRTLKQLRN